jgi:hypothetical protein
MYPCLSSQVKSSSFFGPASVTEFHPDQRGGPEFRLCRLANAEAFRLYESMETTQIPSALKHLCYVKVGGGLLSCPSRLWASVVLDRARLAEDEGCATFANSMLLTLAGNGSGKMEINPITNHRLARFREAALSSLNSPPDSPSKPPPKNSAVHRRMLRELLGRWTNLYTESPEIYISLHP